MSLRSYYKHVGYLTQEPLIFDGTIWENLMYAQEDVLTKDNTHVHDIITAARCEFIYDFPQ